MRKTTLLFVLATAAVFTACDQSGSPLSLARDPMIGAWTFETDRYTYGASFCKISGTMMVAAAENGALQGTLNATDTHYNMYSRRDDPNAIVSRTATAQQACVIVRNGNSVTIQCQVQRSSSPTYAPDDFVLTLNPDGSMTGETRSIYRAPVRFQKTG